MTDGDKNPFEKFKEFVSDILTVTKDDIRKAEGVAKEACEDVAPRPTEAPEEEG
jgi:hypothetical protein